MNTATASFADIVARGRRLAEQNPTPLDMLDTFRLFAEYANDHEDECEIQDLMLTLVNLITPRLDRAKTANWWADLRHALAREQEAKTSGPRAGEEDIDWDALIEEASKTLAGQR